MAEAGLVLSAVSLTGQLYIGCLRAWAVFEDALEFPSESRDLIVSLLLDRFRFQVWGRASGVSQGKLDPNLSPIKHVIQERLRQIKALLRDGATLSEEFGLISLKEESAPISKGAVSGLAHSSRTWAAVLQNVVLQREVEASLAIEIPEEPEKSDISLWKRLRWSLVSKARFEKLLHRLQAHTSTLWALLHDSQLLHANHDWRRVELELVANISDIDSLSLVQPAAGANRNTVHMLAMAEGRVIGSSAAPPTKRYGPAALVPLLKEEFDISSSFLGKTRFITRRKDPGSTGSYYLFEKKSYDPDILPRDFKKLNGRLDRLILLLSKKSQPEDFRILSCIGYCHDARSHCWWLVFRYPLAPGDAPPGSLAVNEPLQPLSLLAYLKYSGYKPALERRLQLASKIANTFSLLYGSEWLHKGIRSDNILFPSAASTPDKLPASAHVANLSSPYLAGFEYSRQYTEEQSIQRTPYNLHHAIYRHPNYQGLAAEGYKVQHDIYSLGLVLAEVAWWVPLSSFLDAEVRGPTAGVPPLSSRSTVFGVVEAMELRKRVLVRLRRELAFRVGSRYAAAVEWCLDVGWRDRAEDEEWQAALEIYNHVVLPLEAAAGLAL